jgi:hypothetical protein
MAVRISGGPLKWWGSVDQEGYREYHVVHLVECDSTDGPNNVRRTPGLPKPGDSWRIDNDKDPWAWCLPTKNLTPRQDATGEPITEWEVESTFSSKPPDPNKQRCNDNEIEDPLLEPAKVSGGSIKYTEEATADRFGFPIVSSSHEQLRGPQLEFDANRPNITIEQNVSSFNAILLAYAMQDCVNGTPIWNVPYRCLKLSDVSWDRKFYGRCYVYFTRKLTFDINYKTFDRTVLDEGSKVLHGHWSSTGGWILDNINGSPPDPTNPQHFDRFQDRRGNVSRVLLNGMGLPAGVQIGTGSDNIIDTRSGPFLLSITTVHEAGDTTDEAKWVRLLSSPTNIQHWQSGSMYSRGTLVHYDIGAGDQTFVQTNGDASDQVPGSGSDWIVVSPLRDRGSYSPTATYAVGDWVAMTGARGRFGSNVSSYGSVYIQKFDEADFYQLGLPLDFSA